MKSPLWFAVAAVAVVLGTGSTLAVMNNACKTGHHPWCAPVSIARHEAKLGPS